MSYIAVLYSTFFRIYFPSQKNNKIKEKVKRKGDWFVNREEIGEV